MSSETRKLIDACDLQWQYVGNQHSVCRFCAFVVHIACDATIEDHMKKCGPLATHDAASDGGEEG